MAIIGFITCVIVLLFASLTWGMLAWDSLGRYNIGGAPNSLGRKCATFLWLVLLAAAWVNVIQHSPVSLSLAAGDGNK